MIFARHMKKSLFWLALLALTVLSLMPTGLLPSQVFSLWDKAQHAIGFAVLALLGLAAYPHLKTRLPLWLLAHGGLIELAQAATGWRYGDPVDWLADAIGIAVGVALWLRFARPRPSA
jgi:VanZ family protein